jgi:PmbA protein
MVEAALLAGAEEAEIYLKTSVTSGILLQEGLATLAGGSERGVALRVFDKAGHWGHAYASWGDPAVGRRLIRSAMDALAASSESGSLGSLAPRPKEPFPTLVGTLDSRVFQNDPAAKRSILDAALKRLTGSLSYQIQASWRDGISRLALVNSRGLVASFQRTLALVTLTRSGGGGPTLVAERVGCGMGEREIDEVADEMARLEEKGEPEDLEPDRILLLSTAVPALMRRFERGVLAAWNVGGGEWSPETRVGSSAVELSDEPLLPAGVASSPFDAEGYPTRRTVILTGGILTPPQNPGECASRPGGRAIRPSYRDLPIRGWTNLVLAPGQRSPEEILGRIDRGICLAALEAEGNESRWQGKARWHGIGWEIRSGRCVGSSKRFRFCVSAEELLKGIAEISSRPRFALHRATVFYCPDLLIRLRD